MKNLKLLFPEHEIQHRIRLLAERINRDYEGKDLVIVGVLNGSVYFVADLTQRLIIEHQLTFVRVSSYKNNQQESQIMYSGTWDTELKNKDILLVDDFCDSGVTISYLVDLIKQEYPASIRVTTLLKRSISKTKPDYSCFEVDNKNWLVGYGLDDNLKNRHLKDIYELVK